MTVEGRVARTRPNLFRGHPTTWRARPESESLPDRNGRLTDVELALMNVIFVEMGNDCHQARQRLNS